MLKKKTKKIGHNIKYKLSILFHFCDDHRIKKRKKNKASRSLFQLDTDNERQLTKSNGY